MGYHPRSMTEDQAGTLPSTEASASAEADSVVPEAAMAGNAPPASALHDAAAPHGAHGAATPGMRWALLLGALGVVFGDIGTSPLYAIKECFSPESPHRVLPTPANILGIRGVAFSGLNLPEDTRRAYDAGFVHFITKPVPDVLGVVTRLLAEPTTTVDAAARAAFFRAIDKRIADATRTDGTQTPGKPSPKGFPLAALAWIASSLF